MSAGSIIRKWDLHVHTPESYENQFGFSSRNDREAYKNNIWEKYIDELEKVKDVSVVGITDYFSIDGYKKVIAYQKNGRLQNFDLILPNIELRLGKFVGGRRLNYHVILSNEIDPIKIEENFLEELQIPIPGAEKARLNRESIESIGKILKEQQTEFKGKTNYYVGCMNITVSLEDIMEALQKKRIFKGKYILVLVEPEWAMIDDWKGQDHLTRKNILMQSHAIFSSNQSTRVWALGKKHRSIDDFVAEFGSLKPCIHGSDAHCFDRLCRPGQNRFCWVKADPTFEGLKQIVYEPEERIKISTENPDYMKNIYTFDSMSINKCIINDELSFKGQKFRLNRNLVTIIGGKGSGKTALLDLMANCLIDRCYRNGKNAKEKNSFVQRIEDDCPDLSIELEFIGPDVESFSKHFAEESFFGDVNITYLPQGQIEEFSGNREKLNDKIKEIIFSNKEIVDSDFQRGFDEIESAISVLGRKTGEINNSIFELEQESTDEILDEIKKELSRKNGELRNKEAQLKELVSKMTAEAQKKIKELRATETELEDKHLKIGGFQNQSEEFKKQLEYFERTSNKEIESLNTQLSELGRNLSIPFIEFRLQLNVIKKALVATAKDDKKVQKEIEALDAELQKLEGFEKIQADLLEAIKGVKEEIKSLKKKLKLVEEKRGEIQLLASERLQTFIDMLSKFLEFKHYYKQMIDTFSKGKSEILSGIDFESSIYFDKDDFISDGNAIVDQRSVSPKEIEDLANFLETATTQDTEEGISKIISQFVNKIYQFRGYLKRRTKSLDFYEWAFHNYFSLNTNVFFDNTPMEKLSIGQKGTVLLKLFLAEGDYPLIVDMPEENLDNMFIYDELVDAFRQAKTKRQVITATNNANLVINTDAEQIVVAEFKDNVISYKIGTIEDNSIRKEVTTILEGGEEALKKREMKYGMV